jgi:UDP-glucose 4-epimerase
MRVLVTGAAGFLGGHIANAFASAGHVVAGMDRSPATAGVSLARFLNAELSFASLRQVAAEVRPDICIHAAGRASVPDSVVHPMPDFENGPLLTMALLEALRLEAPACRTVFLSSAAVYGDPPRLPTDEEEALHPLSPYGYHKWMAELLCQEFFANYGLATGSVRIFSAFGPRLRRQVIFDICRKAATDEEVVLHGTGMESRDFIHATDVAAGVARVATRAPLRGEVYNLASGRETSIRELAESVLRALRSDKPIRFDGRPSPGMPVRWQANIAKIRALGFAPAVDLDTGISSYVQWWREMGQ